MLTIITGTPGAGKTLHTLYRILDENPESENRRPVYVNGVADLDYEFFGALELEEPEKWMECPDGSIIFIDEAQRVFPQRSASTRVPFHAQEFATHRHRGFDVFITTQDATNIDAFVRRMCGRHFHVHRIMNQGVATVYEYDHYESNPTGYHEKKAALSIKAWRYPKKLFSRYHSATVHTHKAKVPFKLYLVGLFFLMAAVGIGYSIYRLSNRSDRLVDPSIQIKADDDGQGFQPGQLTQQAVPVQTFINTRVPRIPGVPESAPLFDEVMSVKAAPKPYCVIIRDFDNYVGELGQCICYTQQMTVYETTDPICRHYVTKGYFDFTIDRDMSRGAAGAGAAAQPAPAKGFSSY